MTEKTVTSRIAKGVLHEAYAEERLHHPAVSFRYKTRARVAQRAARTYLPSRDSLRVLDLGCADGLTLRELCELLDCQSAIGVEVSPDLLSRAPEMSDRIRLLEGDVTALPREISGESVDLVCALAVLEHLPEPLAAMREAFRVLAPGGVLVITCPNPFWDHAATLLRLVEAEQHETSMTRSAMEKLAAMAGFEALAFERFMWAPVGCLPYLGIRVSPDLALDLDAAVRGLRIFDFLFVNQCLILRKPGSDPARPGV